ncbi:MAG: hypothetical protein ACJ76Z_05850 [Thermoleophilaceae bacterium]
MSPRAAAAAVADTLHVPVRTRTRTRPAPPRRRSGAAVRPHAAAPSRRIAVARPAGALVLDRLLRGPAYIALVGVLLAGIVFFNVDVLELNHGIARTDVRATFLERQNAALTQQLARLASSERIQSLAIQRGLVLPEPGDVRYLRANPGDANRAAKTMSGPSPTIAPAAPTLLSQSAQQQTTPPAAGPTPNSQLPTPVTTSPPPTAQPAGTATP